MSRFKSENFSRVTCEGCGEVTTIEPGFEFAKLNCNCKVGLDTERSTPVQEELDYVNVLPYTVIGTFKNGDLELCVNNDLDNTYRVPKATFDNDFERSTPIPKVNPELIPVGDEIDPIKKEGTVTLSIEALKGQTVEAIQDSYNMDELRVLAKSVKIRGASNMGEVKLIGKLLAKAE